MYPTTEILSWKLDRIENRQTLLVNPPDSETVTLFHENVHVHTTDYATFLTLQKENIKNLHFGAEITECDFEAAVLFLPKGREQLMMLASLIAQKLLPNAIFFIVGHNKAGAKTVAKKLQKTFFHAEKIVSARHCTLSEVQINEKRQSQDWTKNYVIGEHSWISLPGVFSADHLDDGSALLLAHRPKRIKGPVLDMGCGIGILGIQLALEDPTLEVDLVDVNAFALEAARRNVLQFELQDRVRVFPSDVYSDVEKDYNLIISNPPFHKGIQTEFGVSSRIIEGAASRLITKGQLLLVANRFLSYQLLIDEAFGRHELLYNGQRYRVMRAVQKRKNRQFARRKRTFE